MPLMPHIPSPTHPQPHCRVRTAARGEPSARSLLGTDMWRERVAVGLGAAACLATAATATAAAEDGDEEGKPTLRYHIAKVVSASGPQRSHNL